MKKLAAIALTSIAFSAPALAEYHYGFGSVYLDHQNWNHGPNAIEDGNDGKGRNQYVLGIDGGAGFSWGELYGFYEYENFDKGGDQRKSSVKGTAHIYLGDTGVSLYGQFYNHDNKNQSEHNRVLGFGYTKLQGDNWFFKPWIGVHDINAWDNFGTHKNINGSNGYMAGWTARYAWDMFGQNFSVVNWNEIEFDRNDEYAENQGGKNGLNGSVLLNWHITQNFSATVQYRYFRNKLGVYGSAAQAGNEQHYGDAIIYRIGYAF